tara:strand:- start:461 stop:1069 length:609 start_codon:yes stop_codon:yes gene_type:complete
MKKIILLVTLSIFTLFAIATKPHTDHVRVDIHKSTIKWKGSKVTEGHEGFVQIQEGVLMIDHGTLVGGQISINMNSISNTDMEGRMKARIEGHLKSDDFFYVEKFPISTLKIREVIKRSTPEGDMTSSYDVVADLTIKGITNIIEFVADININKVEFSATAKIKIDRTQWDIKYHSGNYVKDLGDKLILDEIEFDISLVSAK